VVRYNDAGNVNEPDDPGESGPEPRNAPPFWSTIIWFLLAMVLVVILGLVVKTQGVGW
jgi:hypothetical protein